MYILAKKCADGRILSYLASLNCVLLMNIRYSGQANDTLFRGKNYKERVKNDKF